MHLQNLLQEESVSNPLVDIQNGIACMHMSNGMVFVTITISTWVDMSIFMCEGICHLAVILT